MKHQSLTCRLNGPGALNPGAAEISRSDQDNDGVAGSRSVAHGTAHADPHRAGHHRQRRRTPYCDVGVSPPAILARHDSGEFTSWSPIEERVREEQDPTDAIRSHEEPQSKACEGRPGADAQALTQA